MLKITYLTFNQQDQGSTARVAYSLIGAKIDVV